MCSELPPTRMWHLVVECLNAGKQPKFIGLCCISLVDMKIGDENGQWFSLHPKIGSNQTVGEIKLGFFSGDK